MGFLIAFGVLAVLWVAGTLHGTGDTSQKSAAPPAASTAQATAPAAAAPREAADRPR